MAVNNIFLIGLMGAGKTTVGKLLAKQLDKQFFDADQEIEKRTGVKIPIIFDLEGESGFRARERAAIRELTSRENIVLATGGGAVLDAQNQQALKNNGFVIYLRAKVPDLVLRTRGDKQRPLLQNVDVKQKLEQLLKEREPIYTKLADLIVDTGNQPAQQILNEIEMAISKVNQPHSDQNKIDS